MDTDSAIIIREHPFHPWPKTLQVGNRSLPYEA
jgi:hypothetical protein